MAPLLDDELHPVALSLPSAVGMPLVVLHAEGTLEDIGIAGVHTCEGILVPEGDVLLVESHNTAEVLLTKNLSDLAHM